MFKKRLEDDLTGFIQFCCENLYLLRVFNRFEYGMAVKSLPHLIKSNRRIKLVLIDGLHYLEHGFGHIEYHTSQMYVSTAENFFESTKISVTEQK